MLNQHWEKVYDKKDWELWDKLQHTAPPLTYPFQYDILYKLLKKYFRTNAGNNLNPQTEKSVNQLYRILEKTMAELENAAIAAQERDNKQWHEQRDREEDPNAKSLREEEMEQTRREAASKPSMGKNFNMGRYWIDHFGEYFLVGSSEMEHGDWIKHRPHILSHQELEDAEKFKNNYPAFMEELIRDGWIRISGDIAEMYNETGLHNLATFLHNEVPARKWNNKIALVMMQKDAYKEVTIGDIIATYYGGGFDSGLQKAANAADDFINYWDKAKNKDFSRYWRLLRRKKRKKKASIERTAGLRDFIHNLLFKYHKNKADSIKQSVIGDLTNYSDDEIKNSISYLKNSIMDAEDKYEAESIADSIRDVEDLISKLDQELDKRGLKYTVMERGDSLLPYLMPKASASNVPNPLRENYDYSNEMCGPEWQNRVKCYMKKKKKREAKLEIIAKNLIPINGEQIQELADAIATQFYDKLDSFDFVDILKRVKKKQKPYLEIKKQGWLIKLLSPLMSDNFSTKNISDHKYDLHVKLEFVDPRKNEVNRPIYEASTSKYNYVGDTDGSKKPRGAYLTFHIPADKDKLISFGKSGFMQDLTSKLAHELTHLGQIMPNKGNRDYMADMDGENEFEHYFNEPKEIQAYARQVFEELKTDLKNNPNLLPMTGTELSWHMKRYYKFDKYLTDDSRKMLYNLVYTALKKEGLI